MSLKSDPQKVKEWQNRSRRNSSLRSHKPMEHGRKGMKHGELRRKGDPKLTEWARKVKARDGYCRWPNCARRGPAVTVDAHHKAPRSQRPDLRYDLDNGIVLCRYHHDFAHHAGKDEAITLGILITETYEAAMKSEAMLK